MLCYEDFEMVSKFGQLALYDAGKYFEFKAFALPVAHKGGRADVRLVESDGRRCVVLLGEAFAKVVRFDEDGRIVSEVFGLAGQLCWHCLRFDASVGRMCEGMCGECFVRNKSMGAVERCDRCGGWHVGRLEHAWDVYDYEEPRLVALCHECGREMFWFWCECHGRDEVVPMGKRYSAVRRDGRTYCRKGWNEMDKGECELCSTTVPRERLFATQGVRVCEHCLQKINDTMDIKNRDGLFDYSYKPLPMFIGEGGDFDWKPRDSSRPYIGFELELDGYSDDWSDEFAGIIHREFGGELYCKRDCTLNNGAEVVSHPIDPVFLVRDFPWEKIYALGSVYDMCATEYDGFHLHVSRSAFSNRDIAALIRLYDRNWTMMRKIGMRDEYRGGRWAKAYNTRFDWDDDDQLDCQLDELYEADDRYHAVNIMNDATIEFRLFAAPDNPDTARVLVDVANACVRLVMDYSGDCIEDMAPRTVREKLVERAIDPEAMERHFRMIYGR